MTPPTQSLPGKSRLTAPLDRFGRVEDPPDARRILHPPPEALLQLRPMAIPT